MHYHDQTAAAAASIWDNSDQYCSMGIIPTTTNYVTSSSSSSTTTSTSAAAAAGPVLERMASENAVVIFSISSCCMCHAIKRLFWGMGVNPTVYELDQHPRGKDIQTALIRRLNNNIMNHHHHHHAAAAPVVFIGGKLVGAMDRVMASHINGTLVPLLKDAGALWL